MDYKTLLKHLGLNESTLADIKDYRDAANYMEEVIKAGKKSLHPDQMHEPTNDHFIRLMEASEVLKKAKPGYVWSLARKKGSKSRKIEESYKPRKKESFNFARFQADLLKNFQNNFLILGDVNEIYEGVPLYSVDNLQESSAVLSAIDLNERQVNETFDSRVADLEERLNSNLRAVDDKIRGIDDFINFAGEFKNSVTKESKVNGSSFAVDLERFYHNFNQKLIENGVNEKILLEYDSLASQYAQNLNEGVSVKMPKKLSNKRQALVNELRKSHFYKPYLAMERSLKNSFEGRLPVQSIFKGFTLPNFDSFGNSVSHEINLLYDEKQNLFEQKDEFLTDYTNSKNEIESKRAESLQNVNKNGSYRTLSNVYKKNMSAQNSWVLGNAPINDFTNRALIYVNDDLTVNVEPIIGLDQNLGVNLSKTNRIIIGSVYEAQLKEKLSNINTQEGNLLQGTGSDFKKGGLSHYLSESINLQGMLSSKLQVGNSLVTYDVNEDSFFVEGRLVSPPKTDLIF